MTITLSGGENKQWGTESLIKGQNMLYSWFLQNTFYIVKQLRFHHHSLSIHHSIVTRYGTVDGVLDLLEPDTITVTVYHNVHPYNTSVELDTRLAKVPQPVFHYNTLLASLATNSSLLLRRLLHSIFQQLPGYQPQLRQQLRAPRYMTSGRTVEKTVLLALVV
jgi:hypothetical protein